jgi:hypothetical protein
MQRCRLPVDPRGTAVTATGRSKRTRIRSGIFDFPSVHLIQIRVMEPVPLFENNTDIYTSIERDNRKDIVTVNHQRNLVSRVS